ncbi:MAG TPA: hypothetical protein VM282_09370 [Acidimicrobiales bacterium]|nr:hypothetical protein [Acidimicrobiales bacterium]
MGDSITIALRNTPVVALITDRFWAQSVLVARSQGLADLPRVELPYPLAGSGADNLHRVARDVVDAILDALGMVGR